MSFQDPKQQVEGGDSPETPVEKKPDNRNVPGRKQAPEVEEKAQPWATVIPKAADTIDASKRFDKSWYESEDDSDRGEGG